MDLFTVIDDALAIIKLPKGVQKQVKMYHRGGNVFVAHGGGYVRIVSKFGSEFSTSHPDLKVVDFDAPGVEHAGNKAPEFRPALRVAA